MKANKDELIEKWYAEEEIVRSYIQPESRILDIDTGGGEFLLSLLHPYDKTSATEAYRPIKFWDVGALVWFAHIIEWEFPNFNVKDSIPKLVHAQEILEDKGVIEGSIHRFLLVAKKR